MAHLNSALAFARVFAPVAAIGLILCESVGRTAPLDQTIMASYVTKFAPFVEWPPAALGGGANPFFICTAGRDPFGPDLDELARGQKVHGRSVKVRRIAGPDAMAGCHILFVGLGTPADLLKEAAGKPILTVSDKAAGVESGMVRFVRRGGRIKFEIDNGAARASHMAISSKLLGLAVSVTP